MVQFSREIRKLLVVVTAASACASFAGAAPQALQRNSLGAAFLEVPGLDVKFAQWETRVRDFEAFVNASGYEWKEKPFFPQTSDHPAVNVTLADAQAFCEWLSKSEHASGSLAPTQHYRLPTNTEWDAAAGCQRTEMLINASAKLDSEHKDIFPWGTQWPPPARAGNFNSIELYKSSDGFEFTAPVGSFDADARGLYDMAGNVWEWTTDGGKNDVSQRATLRGGSWQYFRRECLLSSYRYAVPSVLRRPSIGFRCVLVDDKDPARRNADTARRSRELVARPGVSDQEVESLKEQMMRNREVLGSGPSRFQTQDARHGPVSDADKFANWNRLVRGGAEKTFVNSLGISFEPLPSGRALRAGRTLHPQDMESWRTEQADTQIVSESDAGTITRETASAFCKWLTALERGQRKIPADFAYFAVTGATDRTFFLELSTTNQPDAGN